MASGLCSALGPSTTVDPLLPGSLFLFRRERLGVSLRGIMEHLENWEQLHSVSCSVSPQSVSLDTDLELKKPHMLAPL